MKLIFVAGETFPQEKICVILNMLCEDAGWWWEGRELDGRTALQMTKEVITLWDVLGDSNHCTSKYIREKKKKKNFSSNMKCMENHKVSLAVQRLTALPLQGVQVQSCSVPGWGTKIPYVDSETNEQKPKDSVEAAISKSGSESRTNGIQVNSLPLC